VAAFGGRPNYPPAVAACYGDPWRVVPGRGQGCGPASGLAGPPGTGEGRTPTPEWVCADSREAKLVRACVARGEHAGGPPRPQCAQPRVGVSLPLSRPEDTGTASNLRVLTRDVGEVAFRCRSRMKPSEALAALRPAALGFERIPPALNCLSGSSGNRYRSQTGRLHATRRIRGLRPSR
jgi:hypothetical protein